MEHLCLVGTKVYTTGPGHLTKKVTMPIYDKKKIFFSRTISQMTLKHGMQQKGLEPCKDYINEYPGMTLTYFTTRSTLFISAFTLENLEK